jgi:hypothetical protein
VSLCVFRSPIHRKDNKTKGQRGDNIGNWKENGVVKIVLIHAFFAYR